MTRLHIALPVADLSASVAFYAALFDEGPNKEKDGYARFEPAAAAVTLSLNLRDDAKALPGAHFGLKLDTPADFREQAARLDALDVNVREEDATTCCYAVQDKRWLSDPDGNAWEVYIVTDDGSEQSASDRNQAGEARCCAPTAASSSTSATPKAAGGCCG